MIWEHIGKEPERAARSEPRIHKVGQSKEERQGQERSRDVATGSMRMLFLTLHKA